MKNSCELLKFEFFYLLEEMKSLIHYAKYEINFEINKFKV